MKIINHGFGVVEFNNVLSIDQSFLFDYIDYLELINTQTLNKQNLNIQQKNEAGFEFSGNEISQAPSRYTKLIKNNNSQKEQEIMNHLKTWDDAIYRCLVQYCKIYPEATSTVWWCTPGHIAGYTVGQHIGPHCDTQVAYKPGEMPENDNAVHNTISCGLYLNSSVESEELVDNFTYSGGELYLSHPNFSYKPNNGGIILYPSNYIGRHEVKPVTKGNRYAYLKFFASGIPKNTDAKGLNWLYSLREDVNR